MSLSPAAQKISDAAVIHFTEFGYDAASLSTIADAAGIRKATIYSHFKNKDELFLHVFNEAVALEGEFATRCFAEENRAGEGYLFRVADRYSTSPGLRLLLRTAFVPPAPLSQQMSRGYEGFLDPIGEMFTRNFIHHHPDAAQEAALYYDAYLGIIDSVHIELLYASREAADRRRESLWKIFTSALDKRR